MNVMVAQRFIKRFFELLFKEKISNNLEFEIDDIRIYCSKTEKKGTGNPYI